MFPCFHSTNAFINLSFLITGLSILQNGKMPRFFEEDILQEIFSTSSKPNSAIQHLQNGLKCLGIHQVGVILFWVFTVEKYNSFWRNNNLATNLKIQATLKDSLFPDLQPSCLTFDILYKLFYEINLNDCNSFKTSLVKPNFNLDVLYLKLYIVSWSLSCKQIYHSIL